jgi:hypothetical protein
MLKKEKLICVFQELKALHLIKTIYARQSLKVLSSEMDLAKSRLIQKALIKRRGVEISANFVRPPSCETPLKIRRHLVQLLAIRILIPNAGM